MAARANPNVNLGLWVTMACPFRLSSYNRCAICRGVDGGEAVQGWGQVGVGAGGASLGLSFHFAVNQKLLQNIVFTFSKKKLLLKYSIFTYVTVDNSSRSMALSLKM